MKRITLILIIGIIFLSGCEKKNDSIPVSGVLTLESLLYFNSSSQSYYIYGFDFDTAKKIKYESYVSGGETDLILMALPDLSGGYLECPGNDEAFYLYGTYSDAGEAETAFDNLLYFGELSFTYLANPIQENQVWIVQTDEDTYAKLWIKSVEILSEDDESFVRSTLDWVYQSNGSMAFSE